MYKKMLAIMIIGCLSNKTKTANYVIQLKPGETLTGLCLITSPSSYFGVYDIAVPQGQPIVFSLISQSDSSCGTLFSIIDQNDGSLPAAMCGNSFLPAQFQYAVNNGPYQNGPTFNSVTDWQGTISIQYPSTSTKTSVAMNGNKLTSLGFVTGTGTSARTLLSLNPNEVASINTALQKGPLTIISAGYQNGLPSFTIKAGSSFLPLTMQPWQQGQTMPVTIWINGVATNVVINYADATTSITITK